ncbi:MAG: sigma-70 family RNA polymerase sigma factor [Bacteroidota bacterium]
MNPPLASLTDEQLVAAYLNQGDERAFTLLMKRHQERVFGFLVGMVRDRATANDLFQDTFFRVIQAMNKQRGSYEPQGRWLGWVLRIARNAALDHLRSRKKFTDVAPADEDDGASFWDRLADDEQPDAFEQLHQQQITDELAGLIDQLPPEQREVVMLRHEGDLTFREIAEITDVSINTALGRMRYALINLRKMIDAEFEPERESIKKKSPRNGLPRRPRLRAVPPAAARAEAA